MASAVSAPGRVAGKRLPTRERRPGWVVLAAVLVAGLAAAAGYVYVQAGAKTAVVMVVREVPAGREITRSDVSIVSVAGPVRAIAAQEVDSVLGQRAQVTLLPSMFLQRSMISPADAVRQDQAQVGVAVTPGQVADDLQPGDTVDVLQLPGTGSRSGNVEAAQVLVPAARVWSARPDPGQSGGMLVTLVVPHDLSPVVASASGADLIALVKVATR